MNAKLARRTIALLALLPAAASAETLVRHCPALAAGECTAPVYVRPIDAKTVWVLRVGAQWVDLTTVAASERISVCVDDTSVTPGSAGPCATRVPGQTDNWQLKSLVYPTTTEKTGSIDLMWSPVILDTDGNPLTGITYRLFGGKQGQEALVASDLTLSTTVYANAAYGAPYCFWVRAVYQGAEGDDSPHSCITLTQPIVRPAAPMSLELKSTATLQ